MRLHRQDTNAPGASQGFSLLWMNSKSISLSWYFQLRTRTQVVPCEALVDLAYAVGRGVGDQLGRWPNGNY